MRLPILRQPHFSHWPKLLLIVTLLVGASCTWLLASNAGLQWLVAAVVHSNIVKLEYHGLQGRLIGPLQLQTLKLQRGKTQITLNDLALDWSPTALLHGRLELNNVRVGAIAIVTPSSNSDMPMPQDLSLPFSLAISGLHVNSLHLSNLGDNAPYFTALDIAATLSSDGRQFEVHSLQARSSFGQLRASGIMQATHPYALQAQADLTSMDGFANIDTKAHIYTIANGDLRGFDVSARGEGAGLDGTAQAHITPLSTTPLQALNLQVSGLNPQAFAPSAPKAKLNLSATLRGSATQLLTGKVQLHNDSPNTLDLGGLPVVDASALLGISSETLRGDEVLLKLQGGATITGNLTLQRDHSVANLRVAGLNPAALDSRLRDARLHGSIKLSGDAKEQHGKLNLSGTALQLSAELQRNGDKLTLQQLSLTSARAELSGTGELNLGQLQPYNFNGQLRHFDLTAFVPHAPHTDLNATLMVSGALQPHANGKVDFEIRDSHLAQQPISGQGHISYQDLAHGKGELLIKVGDNRLNLNGSYGKASDSLSLLIEAPALAQLGTGYGGTLQLHASFTGDLAHPNATLQADAQQLTLPDSNSLDKLSISASLHGDALAVNMQAGELSGPSRTLLQNASFEMSGTLTEHEVRAQARLAGEDSVQLRGRGGWHSAARWQGELTELVTAGQLNAHLLHPSPVSIARNSVSLGLAEIALAGGRLTFDTLEWTPQLWRTRGHFNNIGLRTGHFLQNDTTAPQALRLGGAWNIQAAAQLSGDVEIHREQGDLILPSSPPTELGLEKLQLSAHARAGKISTQLNVSGSRLGELQAHVSVAQSQSGMHWQVPHSAPLSGHVHFALKDLSLIGAALNGELKTGGRITLDAEVAGTLGAPRLLGTLVGEQLSFALLEQGVRLEQGRLSASFDKQTLHIDELVFLAPHDAPPRDTLLTGVAISSTPGALHASGNIDLNGADSDLEISAFQVPLTQRKDRWIIASGSGHARLKDDTLSLSGSIIADAGLIRPVGNDRPQLSKDVVLMGRQSPQRQGPRISVDASLDLGDHFYLRASGLEARLAGKLHARQSPGQVLRVNGAISTRDATFAAYGQNLTVERGIVNFGGPIYDPGLNILAVRKGLTVEAGVSVTGTVLHPIVQLVSTPTVPDTEKLSWIVLGRQPDTSGTDLALLLAAAEGVVGGGGSGGVTSQLKQSMGIDQLTLRSNTSSTGSTQTATAADPLSNQIAVVGKRLSARAYLSYEQGVTAAAGVTKLTYTLTPRINLITQAGFENSIDVTYSFRFE